MAFSTEGIHSFMNHRIFLLPSSSCTLLHTQPMLTISYRFRCHKYTLLESYSSKSFWKSRGVYLPSKWKLTARTSLRGCVLTAALQAWTVLRGERCHSITIMIHFESCMCQLLPAGKTIIAMTWVLRRVEIWYFSRSRFFPLFSTPLCESTLTSNRGRPSNHTRNAKSSFLFDKAESEQH